VKGFGKNCVQYLFRANERAMITGEVSEELRAQLDSGKAAPVVIRPAVAADNAVSVAIVEEGLEAAQDRYLASAAVRKKIEKGVSLKSIAKRDVLIALHEGLTPLRRKELLEEALRHKVRLDQSHGVCIPCGA